jgi:hypothetical protein
MTLRAAGHVDLPPHRTPSGFDHAAVHRGTGRLYVAHTANDALDVIDLAAQRYEGSLEGLTGRGRWRVRRGGTAVASCAADQLEGRRRLPRRGVDHQEAERSLG